MPQVTRKETERRLRKMAKAAIDMKQGLYDWPNGLSPTLPDGTGRFQYKELLRVGEYSTNTHNGGKHLFEDPYFKRECRKELARREAKLPSVFDANPGDLHKLGQKMITEALIRLEADPESFTTSQLLQFGPTILKLALDLKAKDDRDLPGAPKTGDPKMAQFNAFVGRMVVNMSDEEREDFRATGDEAREARFRQLAQMIDAAQNADDGKEDPDVVDVPVTAEPS